MVQNASVAPDSPGRPSRQSIALGALYTALVALALWVIRDFIPAIAWAGVVAIALWPALRRIDTYRWFHGRTTLVATALTTAVALLVVVPIAVGLAEAVDQSHELFGWLHRVQETGIPAPDALSHLPFGAQQARAWWQAHLAQPLHPATAVKGVDGGAVMTFGRHFGSRLAHAAMLFGFMLVTLFVIFQAGPRLSGALLTGVQRAFGENGAALLKRMAAAVYGTVTGLVVVGFGEGVLLGIAYALAGLPHAALLGLVTAIAAMLPFCAPVVFCGAALWLFAQGAVGWAIGLAVFGFVVAFVAEHFVRPVLIGSSARLPFLLVLFGILGGAETFGLLGLFVGPALMTVLTVLWAEWVD
ncbi:MULTISPECIES: AI-2E family transporter [Burkholderia]|uniref:Putative membrane protein n=1 Tax=Burkholderia singularis TaxID=1503053 RepID=A0A238H0J4_9BURK|nr:MULTISPECIES: AI-2E family transporter [Burkholderia]AOK31641.1 hypothetical protein AQ611_19070 [Burkholderia sp. Bp7605]SMF98758.1 putative membrane protein [Burkholderia singularis]